MASSSSIRPSTARRLPAVFAAATLSLGLTACGGGDGDSAASTPTTATTSASTATTPPAATAAQPASTPVPDLASTAKGSCRKVSAPDPRSDDGNASKPSPATLTGAWTVTMRTNCGSFTIALDTARQPKTTASFKSLVASKFYDGLTFHRIAADFVIQGGDPAGDGTGGPGYSVTETPPADAAYTQGVVAMAKTADEADGTSGSQFYVVTAPDSGLPPQYAIVGKVVSGLSTIARIAAVGSTGPPDDAPNEPVVISSATAKKG